MNTSRTLSEFPLAIGLTDHGYALVARAEAEAGQVLFGLRGEIQIQPSRFSVQVGIDKHLDLPADCTLREQIQRYAWSFLNHCCAPNTRIVGRDVIAIRTIRSGEELSFDYDDNEFRMAEPFDCACGASTCRGQVGGFAHLSRAEQVARLPSASEHLRNLHHFESQTSGRTGVPGAAPLGSRVDDR